MTIHADAGPTKWVYDGVCRRRIHRDEYETVQAAAGTDEMGVQMVQVAAGTDEMGVQMVQAAAGSSEMNV